MTRLVSFALVISTAFAALLVLVIQPHEAFRYKKRFYETRPFLLACVMGEKCPPNGGGPMCGNATCEIGETATSCPADCSGGGETINGDGEENSSGGSSDTQKGGPLGYQAEKECLTDISLEFQTTRKEIGAPEPLLNSIITFCLEADDAATGGYGNTLLLDEAGKIIQQGRVEILRHMPGAIDAATIYIGKGLQIMTDFNKQTASYIYLSDPIVFAIQLYTNLEVLWKPPAEKPKEEIKEPEPVTPPPPVIEEVATAPEPQPSAARKFFKDFAKKLNLYQQIRSLGVKLGLVKPRALENWEPGVRRLIQWSRYNRVYRD